MNEIINLLAAFTGGIMLGIIFFGGLWLTVSRGMRTRNPGVWFILSMLLRSAIVITGFYLMSDGGFSRLIACLAGFVIFKVIITQKLKLTPQSTPANREEHHD